MPPAVFRADIRAPDVPPVARGDEDALTPEQRAFASALRERYAIHVKAMDAADVESLLSFFTDDAIWVGSGWPTRAGRSQLRELFTEVAGTATVVCRSLYTYVDGDTGWDFVDYAVTPRDPSVTPWIFRTAFQWVRREGSWLCNAVLCYPAP